METGPEVLRRWRKARDLSQHDLAVAVGLTAGAISQFERSVFTPRRRVAETIDEQLDAGGEIVAAFGYVTQQPDAIADLTDRVARLERAVRYLLREVDATKDVDELLDAIRAAPAGAQAGR